MESYINTLMNAILYSTCRVASLRVRVPTRPVLVSRIPRPLTLIKCNVRVAFQQKVEYLWSTVYSKPENDDQRVAKRSNSNNGTIFGVQGGHVRRSAGRHAPARVARGRSRTVNTGHNPRTGARLEARNSSMSLCLWNLAHWILMAN